MNPLNKILLGAGVAVVVTIIATFVWLSLANAHLRAQLAEAVANGTACHFANNDFAARITEQNRAVATLQSESSAREKSAQVAMRAAEKTAQGYLLAAVKIRKTTVRGDNCRAAEDIVNAYIGSAQ